MMFSTGHGVDQEKLKTFQKENFREIEFKVYTR